MRTVYGVVTDALGHASATTLQQGERRPELRMNAWATPSSEVRSVQNPEIRIDRDHDHRWVGEIIYLERRDGNLWAVGHIDDRVRAEVHVKVGDDLVTLDHDLYWSPERIGGADDGILFTSIALTASPARIAPKPVKILEGALDHRDAPRRWNHTLGWHERELLERAANTY